MVQRTFSGYDHLFCAEILPRTLSCKLTLRQGSSRSKIRPQGLIPLQFCVVACKMKFFF